MEKAFDPKDLVKKMEPAAEAAADGLIKWIEESVAIHPSPYLKFALPVIAAMKPVIKEQLDKIDGQAG